MKNSLRFTVVVLLSILLAVYLSACGDSGGEESVTDKSSEFVQLMVDLDDQAMEGQISDEDVITQYNNILDQLDEPTT